MFINTMEISENIIFILCFVLQLINCEITKHFSDAQNAVKSDNRMLRIAIIGGGIGGTSSGYFVSKLFENYNNNTVIDLYEKSDSIGGRLSLETVNDKEYESGGSIIHERNKYAADFVNKFGLSRRKTVSDDNKICIYNGNTFVFCESHWQMVTALKVWFRYGFDIFRLRSYVNQLIDDFERIYKLQNENVYFESVAELLNSMSPLMTNLTKITFDDFLNRFGFSKNFINEIAQSITMVNYGQTVTIPALVGCISYAGSGADLWSVKNGNKQLPVSFAKNSKANIFLSSSVESITKLDNEMFEIRVHKETGENFSRIYDSVIIAMPLIDDTLKFVNFSNSNDLHTRKYQRTVATLISGKLNEKFKDRDVLSDNSGTFFTSIGRIYPVNEDTDENSPVYKIFSRIPLSSEQLNEIFDEIKEIRVTDWNAYPLYDSVTLPLPRFVLYPGIFHVNAIEWASSAMEMSIIGGKNAALLTYGYMGGDATGVYDNKIDRKNRIEL